MPLKTLTLLRGNSTEWNCFLSEQVAYLIKLRLATLKSSNSCMYPVILATSSVQEYVLEMAKACEHPWRLKSTESERENRVDIARCLQRVNNRP